MTDEQVHQGDDLNGKPLEVILGQLGSPASREDVEKFRCLIEDIRRDERASLVDSQVAENDTPLCVVHKSLDERNDLVLEIGNDCVACSLNERSELLNVLVPLAKPDGTQDSITVLNNAIENAATSMRSRCIEKVKETEFLHHVDCAAAVNKEAVCTCFAATIKSRLITALGSIAIQQQEKQP